MHALELGYAVGISPASWKFRGLPGDPNQRISVILSFRYVGLPRKLTLYPPAHHREMVARLYQNIGAEHEYAVPVEVPDLTGASEMLTGANESEGCAEIHVRSCGNDVVREVRRLLRSFCLQHYSAVNLFLNLESPTTYRLAAEFEKLGFFFAGVLPRARIGDALILQFLNNVDLDYSKITACSDTAKEILAYIRARS